MNNITTDEEECVAAGDPLVRFVMHGVLLNGIGAGGLLGNALAWLVLSRPQMRSSINCLLIGLAACDTALILTSVLLFGLTAVYPYTGRMRYYYFNIYPHLTPYVFPLFTLARNMSVYLTLMVTVERWLAVCRPFRAMALCTRSHARWCVLGTALFSFLYNIPKFFEFEVYCMQLGNDVIYCWRPTNFRSKIYVEVYLYWMHIVVMHIIPFSALAALNACIVRQVRRAQAERARLSIMQRHELRLTIMLLVVVLIFFACNILRFVSHACEAFLWEGLQNIRFVVDTTNILLAVFYSSVNFVIYITFSKKFKNVFLKTLSACRGKARSGKVSRGSPKRKCDDSLTTGDRSNKHEDTVNGVSSTTAVRYPAPAPAPATAPAPALPLSQTACTEQEHYI